MNRHKNSKFPISFSLVRLFTPTVAVPVLEELPPGVAAALTPAVEPAVHKVYRNEGIWIGHVEKVILHAALDDSRNENGIGFLLHSRNHILFEFVELLGVLLVRQAT